MILLLKYVNTNCYYIKGKNDSLLVDTTGQEHYKPLIEN